MARYTGTRTPRVEDARLLTGTGTYVDDHGGWSYTTVVGQAPTAVLPTALTAETLEVRWVHAETVPDLPLHPGFAATWETVRAIA